MTIMEKTGKYIRRVPLPVWLAVVFALGFLVRGNGGDRVHVHEDQATASQEPVTSWWTCSMHPQIRQPEPGQCPICGMDLIPVSEGSSGDALGPRQIRLSENARRLAGVRTEEVRRIDVESRLSLVGTIRYDETKVSDITAWVPGRIDRMQVDFTGTRVRRGEPMVYLYSPELYAAQEEYLQALSGEETFSRSRLASIRETAELTARAAREKLANLGLSEAQIEAVTERGEASSHLTIHSPAGGTVVEKNALEGQYVSTGARLYRIADLSRLWVELEAYESDLPWLELGQRVQFTTESRPGETFSGRVVFIDPVVDPRTRTAGVRLEVDNSDGRLKPEMYVRATVKVRASESRADSAAPLVIPASAPLITGERAVVYVAVPGEEGVYEGREVVLGRRAGSSYLVRSGLSEGEMVVVNGNFKIDSAIQIKAGPSMMNPPANWATAAQEHAIRTGAGAEQGVSPDNNGNQPVRPGDVPREFKRQLDPLYETYFELQRALVEPDLDVAVRASERLAAQAARPHMELLGGAPHMRWMELSDSIGGAARELAGSSDIETARRRLAPLSEHMAALAREFGAGLDRPVVLFHCPMALDNRGALWLQDNGDTRNPYYGEMMLKCQDRIDTLYTASAAGEGGERR